MHRVGTVSRTAQGLAIARYDGSEPPEIGQAVVDEDLSRIGRIVDVFGPVEHPYVAVSIDGDRNPASLLGSKLYAR